MNGGFPHVHLGANAGEAPDPVPRGYRLSVLLQRVTEAEALEVALEVADVLAARGIAIRDEDETVRSVIGVDAHDWPQSLGTALHLVVPKAVPQTPDLGVDYSPN